MAKKKRKKKNRHERDAVEAPLLTPERPTGISPASLATFTQDLSAFGSRAGKPTRASDS